MVWYRPGPAAVCSPQSSSDKILLWLQPTAGQWWSRQNGDSSAGFVKTTEQVRFNFQKSNEFEAKGLELTVQC